MRARYVVSVIAVLFTIAVTARAQIYVDRSPPPRTVSEQVSVAAIVVRARVALARLVPSVLPPVVRPTEMTMYDVVVTDVVKGTGIAGGSTLTLIRFGGARSNEVGFRPFVADEELLLFLNWWPAYSAYTPMFGPDSVFGVSGDVVEPFGKAAASVAEGGRSATELIAALKATAAK
jgi:hypothetical protein